MSGLLDKKSRILDYIITDIGKEELVKGELSFEYAAFSDLHSLYEEYSDFDPTNLLAFEATSLPSDLVISDLEDNGRVLSINMTQAQPENIVQVSTVGGININTFETYLKNVDKPLINQSLISNKQEFADRDEFVVTPLVIAFKVTDRSPIPINKSHLQNLNAVPNIFQDPDFKTKQNFKFLPPTNPGGSLVFDFDDITAQDYDRNSKDVISRLKDEQHVLVQFEETSDENNLIIQFFEKTSNELSKLKIVTHESEDNDNSTNVFFIGKTFRDDRGVESFIKIFTLVIIK